MRRASVIGSFLSSSLLLPSLLPVLLSAACTSPIVTLEVLPPRTSVTCAAPDASSAAFSRGVLDVRATETVHGGYLADVRLTSTGADARVDGVRVKYASESSAVETAAQKEDGAVLSGDAVLVGEDADIRKGVLENVELVSGGLAKALNDVDGFDDVDFATLQIDIEPIVADDAVATATASFALELCKGCLVGPPSTDLCPNGSTGTSVCRVGQDVPSFACLPGGQ